MPEHESQAAHRERVYAAFADRSRPVDEAVGTALSVGADRLGVETGFVTRIEDGTQYIEHAVGDHDVIERGHTCPLDEAYCRRTVELDGQLSVQDAEAAPEISEPAYDLFELGSYIGCKIVVDDAVYGTVCFADEEPRESPFAEAESLFVELIARLVGRAFERQAYEQRQAKRTDQLRSEKRRFEALSENTFDIIYRIDTDGEFTFVSGAVERVLGYAPEEAVGDTFASYLTDQSDATALDAFERLLSGDPVQGVEFRFDHRDGHSVTVEINATPLTDDDGEVTAIQGVGRDVTERKEQQAELRIRTRAMEVAAIPITMADATRPDNPIIYANQAFERVTGYSKDQITGQTWELLTGPGTDAEAVADLTAGIDANRPVTVQLLNYRRDETPFWNRITVTPIRDEDGAVSRYLWFQEDVTDQQRTTRLVELLNRVLRHNLRNELTVIEGYTDFITDTQTDTDVQAGIRRPLRRLISLGEQARQLEQLSKTDHQPVRLDPGTVIGTVVARHRDRTPPVAIETDIDTSRDICAGTELERAIDELVTNAITHGDEGVTVSLSAREAGDCIVVTVRDDGPGVSEHERSVIDRGHESPLQHGKGLGLWLVNWITTQYGGSFDLAVDDGTVATLRLPAVAADQSVEAAARRPTALHR